MIAKLKMPCSCLVSGLLGMILGGQAVSVAQGAKLSQSYPAHLPYSFGNFVWWSDDELRLLLKERIPGLGDEIPTTTAGEGRMRDALKALLKEKGVTAEIQSQEPSYSAFGAQRDPEVPAPSIQFSIMDPQILLDRVELKVEPVGLASLMQSESPWGEGRAYSAFGDWFIRSRIKNVLSQKGYLGTQVQVQHPTFRKDGSRVLVNLEVTVNAGPQYHVSAISVEGGPLLKDRDLSPLFGMKVGDVPGRFALGGLAGKLRDFYLHYGYADVEVENLPILDRERALVAYRLSVIPGPVYHLRTLIVQNLNFEQEGKARELLGMKPIDIYLDEAINGLYRKIADEPMLKGYHFSYGPKKDEAASQIDLTLDFYKEGNESSVTIK